MQLKIIRKFIIKVVKNQHLTPDYAINDKMEQLKDVRYIGCGSYHTFIIQSKSSNVLACGLNQYAQLGIETKEPTVPYFVEIPSLNKIKPKIAEICGGEHYSAARTYNGKVYTWGRCDQSQLGVAGFQDSKAGDFQSQPQEVSFPQDEIIIHLSCGSAHVACISLTGKLYTWGFGDMLQLGSGEEGDKKTPFHVTEIDKIFKYAHNVSAGGQHTIAMFGEKL